MRNKLEESMMLIENTISFLEKYFFNDIIHRSVVDQYYKHLYIGLLNNQADILYNLQRYDEALIICDKIQDVMINFESSFIYELVLKLKIQILYMNNLINLAQNTYDEFVIVCKLKKNHVYLDKTNKLFVIDYPLLKINEVN